MDIEFGNAGELNTNGTGWFVGFSEWTKANKAGHADLRYMPKGSLFHTIHVKWMTHPVRDPRGNAKPPSEGRTISILVSKRGEFRLKFSADDRFRKWNTVKRTLKKQGDFVIWGENIHHCWRVDKACTILTIRWIPIDDGMTGMASEQMTRP